MATFNINVLLTLYCLKNDIYAHILLILSMWMSDNIRNQGF